MLAFLVDANLPPRLAAALRPIFPGTLHVREVGLASADDRAIWDYARDTRQVILSKDGDFHHLSLTLGSPPKVVWIRAGNSSTAELIALVTARVLQLTAFGEDPTSSLLILNRSG